MDDMTLEEEGYFSYACFFSQTRDLIESLSRSLWVLQTAFEELLAASL